MDNNYWADYDDALCEQYDKELADKLAEQDAIDAEQAQTETAPEQPLIQRKPIYWDVSGDDSSLNPSFW